MYETGFLFKDPIGSCSICLCLLRCLEVFILSEMIINLYRFHGIGSEQKKKRVVHVDQAFMTRKLFFRLPILLSGSQKNQNTPNDR